MLSSFDEIPLGAEIKITTDSTLTGAGTATNPLSVVQNYVTLTGNQTIAGVKTFSSSPLITGKYNTSWSEPVSQNGKFFFKENDYINLPAASGYGDNFLSLWSNVASATIGGTGSTINHIGISRIKSSTSANSGGRIYNSNVYTFILGGYEVFDAIFKIETTTNTSGRIGFIDNSGSTTPSAATNGVYFEFSGTTLSPKITNASSTETGTTYTITENTWYRARIVTGSTTSTFYLFAENGTELLNTTVIKNLPTAALIVSVSAVSSGTSSVFLLALDYASLKIERELIR